MRHRKYEVKLGRRSAHVRLMLGNLVADLIRDQRVATTLPKARAARRLAERMVGLGKQGTLAARRRAVARLGRRDSVKKLFEEIAPLYAERQGGYTRIIKLPARPGDNAPMALLEWVRDEAPAEK